MSRSLNDLRPEMRRMVDPFLDAVAAEGIDLLVVCTYRSPEEQARAYAQGRTTPGPILTRAKPGQSAHNFGLAIDVVPIVDGKAEWSEKNPIWKKIGEIGQAAGMQWYGAPGSPFPEVGHFQHPEWKLLAQQIPV